MNKNYLVVAAHARSGSTHLCRLLEQIQEFKVYFEIFHFQLSVIEHHLQGDYQKVASLLHLPSDPDAAREKIVQRPIEYLETLALLAPDKRLIFKLFPGHLHINMVESVIHAGQIAILLKRNPLHSHLSNLIATKTNRWGWHDTSDKKVRFDPPGFDRHLAHISRFNRTVSDIAQRYGKAVVTVDYESLAYQGTTPACLAEMIGGHVSEQLTVASHEHTSRKQDKRVDATEKVDNPEEMLEHLSRKGLERLVDGREPHAA